MKKLFFSICTVAVLLIHVPSFAQVPPEGINYQAVARDTTGRVMSNVTNLSVRFSIYSQLSGGAPLFTETHTAVSTNRYGLFTLIVGSIDTIGFPAIPWAVGNKYLEIAVDSGGNGFVTMPNRTQLMSVPFALYAKTAGNSTNTSWSLLGNTSGSIDFIGTINAQDWLVKTANTERIRVKAGGKVGIGTSTPGAGLVVSGSGLWSPAIGIENTSGGTEWRIASDNNGSLKFVKFPGTSFTALTIDSLNGYIGIGTMNPGAKLEVAGQVKITGGTPGTGKVLTSDALGLATWNSPALPIYIPGTGLTLSGTTLNSVWTALGTNIYNNNIGNVGIGTTTPDGELEVISTSTTLPHGIIGTEYNSNAFADSHIWLRKARGTESLPSPVLANDEIGSLKFRGYDGTSFSTNDQTEIIALASENFNSGDNGSYLKFMTTPNGTQNGSERMRIDQNGNVGIGTTGAPTSLLDVKGTISITGNNANELNRAQTGAANLVPVAYGNISSTAVVNTSTGNLTAVWDNSNGRYRITILGESYLSASYITMVTAIGGNVKVDTNDDGSGNLLVTIYDPVGTKTQNAFQFITYKP